MMEDATWVEFELDCAEEERQGDPDYWLDDGSTEPPSFDDIEFPEAA
jgi:hypothetical protein